MHARQLLFLLPVEQTRNDDEPVFTYYINDGVYGSFASKLSEKLNTIPEVHKVSPSVFFKGSLYYPCLLNMCLTLHTYMIAYYLLN